MTHLGQNKLSLGAGSLDYIDLESIECQITLDPKDFNFVAGDKVKLAICAYHKTAAGHYYFKATNTLGGDTSLVESDELTVQNAGSVHVKIGGLWKEGQVWILRKDSGGNLKWIESSGVYVRKSDLWKESK